MVMTTHHFDRVCPDLILCPRQGMRQPEDRVETSCASRAAKLRGFVMSLAYATMLHLVTGVISAQSFLSP